MGECVFCDIVAGNAPCHRVWEDEEHLAFLSIFPNTKGFTVVIPKLHYPAYLFELPDETLSKLVIASKRVARLLDSKLEGVGRTGMFFEGFGVDHAHSKLSPMHGTAGATEWQSRALGVAKYFDRYEGYLSSYDWERADDSELAALARYIRQ